MDYKNYYKNHSWYNNNVDYIWSGIYLENNFWKILKDENLTVLDIWCWQWKFANFCKIKGVKKYYWVDLDEKIIEINNKNNDNSWYIYIYQSIFDFIDIEI